MASCQVAWGSEVVSGLCEGANLRQAQGGTGPLTPLRCAQGERME